MKRWKKITAAFLAVAALSAATSCGRRGGDENTLYYLNFKPEVASVYEKIAEKYKEETGVTLKVVTAASGEYEQTLRSEIAKADAPTLFQVNGPKGYAAWKDFCEDLSGTEIYKHLSDKSLAITDGEGVYGIPYVVEGYGIIYNEAIMDKYFALPDRGTQFSSVDEVNSFSEFKALVEDMTAHKSALGIDGVFAVTSLKSGSDWRWQTHLANLPVYYEFESAGTDLGSDATGEIDFSYNAQYKQMFDLYIDNSTTDKKLLGSKEDADSMAEFALGRCAMVQNGNWAWEQIDEITGNTVKEEDVKMMPIYIGAEGEESQGICVGTENYFAVNKQSSEEKKQLAYDFMLWLYTSETGKKFVIDELGFIPPFDTFDADERPDDPLAKQVMDWMERDGVSSVPWIFTVFPSQNFKSDFGAALLRYAQGTLPWEDVVSTVKRRWKEESALAS